MNKGGPGSEASKLVGTDEYGNQYFEDLDTNYMINKRWIEFSENHKFLSVQHLRIPPAYNGWLCYIYDEFPNKKNFVEPRWRSPRSFKLQNTHPFTSNYNMAPGSFGNPQKEKNIEFFKQKSFLEWDPPKHEHKTDIFQYDKVKEYDITKH